MVLELVLITGMSGSGKSVALHALEDAGYYCIDNLPPELLMGLVQLNNLQHGGRLAIAMDARSGVSLPQVPQALKTLRAQGILVHSVFLDATTDTLVRRFSETRRRHPLSHDELETGQQALTQIIEVEREILSSVREDAYVIDTSTLRAAQLKSYIKSVVNAGPGQPTLVFQSFAFKRGTPIDADYVFDVRMLPNPYYEIALRDQTGMDEPVASFLRQQPEVQQMQEHIQSFLSHWLGYLARDHRSYVTVAIGCTGGQHRSVYLIERLMEHFQKEWTCIKRHREMDGR